MILFLFLSLVFIYYDVLYYRVPTFLAGSAIVIYSIWNTTIPSNLFEFISLMWFVGQVLFTYYYIFIIRYITHKGMGIGDAFISALVFVFLRSLWLWLLTLLCASIVALCVCVIFKKKVIFFTPFLLIFSLIFYILI